MSGRLCQVFDWAALYHEYRQVERPVYTFLNAQPIALTFARVSLISDGGQHPTAQQPTTPYRPWNE